MIRKDELIEKTYIYIYIFIYFLENHYVSKDEGSKQHLNVIKGKLEAQEEKMLTLAVPVTLAVGAVIVHE